VGNPKPTKNSEYSKFLSSILNRHRKVTEFNGAIRRGLPILQIPAKLEEISPVSFLCDTTEFCSYIEFSVRHGCLELTLVISTAFYSY